MPTTPGAMYLPDVGADDVDALGDSKEDVGIERSASGQTNSHEGASWPEVVNRLLVRCTRRSSDDGGMRSKTVCGILDILDEILGLLEVDPFLRTELETKITLLGTSI